MGNIETAYDFAKELTVVKATGKMAADDFRKWTESYYAGGNVTSLHLWDVTAADLSEITLGDIQRGAALTKRLADMRKRGKTAIVARKDVDFGISRMGELHYDLEVESVEYQTFRTLDEAKEWLGI